VGVTQLTQFLRADRSLAADDGAYRAANMSTWGLTARSGILAALTPSAGTHPHPTTRTTAAEVDRDQIGAACHDDGPLRECVSIPDTGRQPG
jgi:hypothetical protein